MKVKSLSRVQLFETPMDCSPPGSSIHGIFQVRVLECSTIKPYATPAAAAKLRQLCPTLCNPIDGSPSGSPVPGILQARILEWVAISFSTMQYYSAIKKNEIMPFAATRMDLEIVILSEVSQSKRNMV